MVNIREMLVDSSKYGLKCPHTMTPTRIVVHNTANDASANNEIAYMRRNDNEVSFHAAVDDKEIVIGIPFDRGAWHCGDGNGKGNREGIAIEICYSLSGGEKFDQAERNAAEFIASILSKYGWGIDKVTKHQDYNGKYCPHRTLDNGWERFLNMVRTFIGEAEKPAETKPQAQKMTLDEITGEVLAGKWGNNPERKQKLIAAGYDYDAIQKKINLGFGVSASDMKKPALQSINAIALEVIAAKWGDGQARKDKLRAAGYDPDAVQNEVNRILGAKPAKKSNAEIAKEVSLGLWGDGQARKDRLRAAGYDYDAVQRLV